MNKSIFLTFSVLYLLLLSCTDNKKGEIENIIIEFSDENLANYKELDIVDTTILIVLNEGKSKNKLKHLDNIVLKNGLIYASDSYYAHFAVFNSEGEFLNTVGQKGNGRGEYLSVSSFYVTDLGEVYIYDGRKDKIYLFDSKHRFVKDFPVKFEAENFTCLANNDFMFTLAAYNAEESSKGKRILITDSEFNIKSSSLEVDVYIDENVSATTFLNKYNNEIVYNRPYCNQMHVFSNKGTLNKSFRFDFKGLNIPPEKLKDIENNLWKTEHSYCYIQGTPIVVGGNIFSIFQKGDDWRNTYTCIYNTKTKKTYLNPLKDFSVKNINMPEIITEDGSILTYINDFFHPNYKDDPNISDHIKTEIENGSHVLCLYKLKCSTL